MGPSSPSHPTHPLLGQISERTQQNIRNWSLKSQILEFEENLQKRQVLGLSQKSFLQIYDATKKANMLLHEFERECDYSGYRRLDRRRLLRECGQEMQEKHLKTLQDAPNPSPLHELSVALQGLQGLANTSPEKHAELADALQRCCQLTTQSISQVEKSQLDSSEFVSAIHGVLQIVQNTLSLAPVGSLMVEAEEELRRQLWNIQEVTFAQSNALADGDVEMAERQYYVKIPLQEKVLASVTEQVERLDRENALRAQSPALRVANALAQVRQVAATIVESKDRLVARLEKDVQHLSKAVMEAERNITDMSAEFDEERQRSDNLLQNNMYKQESLWRQMAELERELCALGMERRDEVRNRLARVERYEKAKTDYKVLCETSQQHHELLTLNLANCNTREAVAYNMQDVGTLLCDAVHQRLQQYTQDVVECQQEMRDKYHETFRDLYLTNGELIHRKQNSAEQLQQKIQVNQMQLEMCWETLNPNAKAYAQASKELTDLKQQIKDQVSELESRSDLYLEWYKPVETLLLKRRPDLKHPKEELAEINARQLGKLIEYEQMMTSQIDSGDTDHELELLEQKRIQGNYALDPPPLESPDFLERHLAEAQATRAQIESSLQMQSFGGRTPTAPKQPKPPGSDRAVSAPLSSETTLLRNSKKLHRACWDSPRTPLGTLENGIGVGGAPW